jgi:hypothetical protein
MTTTSESAPAAERPPYRLALLAGLVLLVGYVFTLAPSVTFWDAGEFIASAHILGIPHPPGTPLYILIAHTWDALIPGLATAVKLNLLSALFSAGCSVFFFLFTYEALRRGTGDLDTAGARLFRAGGAFAAALVSGFAFTVWQISDDAGKVYPIAMFLIGASAWMVWLWRRERGGPRGAHLLLLITYVLGLALANHLIGLLAGPALFSFMFHVLRTQPAKDLGERKVQWAQFFVMVALWVALVGLSQGGAGKPILILGILLYVAAAVYAFRAGTGLFGASALVVALLGISAYTFLYIRAGLHPYINEADASAMRVGGGFFNDHFGNLWAVIGREQYPPRSPFDNPIYPSGPDNPHRTLQIFGLQLLNWLQYFDWQWSNGLQRSQSLLAPMRIPFTVLFTALGLFGLLEHRKWDRSSWWFLFGLFATTSLGLVLYLNFKPGFSIGYGAFPDREMHEVRERDYFFTVAWLSWGLWAGIGIAALFKKARERLRDGPVLSASPVLLLALLPLVLNFKSATRRQTPDAMLAHDFAYDLLNSVEPYGILFTNGDNDTFPLWYAQEVEGIRQDVVNVNLSLVNTDWYIRQLRDNPVRPYRPDSFALKMFGPGPGTMPACSPAWSDTLAVWARRAHRRPPDPRRGPAACLHTLTDEQVATLEPMFLPRELVLHVGGLVHSYPAGTPLYVKDIMTLRLIQENFGKRPIYFALTAGQGARMGLDKYVLQQGMVFKLMPDTVRLGPDVVPGIWNSPMDLERSRYLTWDMYRYADLFKADTLDLEPTTENIAANLSFAFLALGEAYRTRGRVDSMLMNYRRANHLAPGAELSAFIRQFDALQGALPLPGATGDSAHPSDSGRAGDSGRARAGARGSPPGR